MESPSSEDHFVVLSLREKTKILGLSKPKNRTRARNVSPADKGAAGLSQSLPGVFQDVGGPV